MFSTQSDNCIYICLTFDIISLFAAELEEQSQKETSAQLGHESDTLTTEAPGRVHDKLNAAQIMMSAFGRKHCKKRGEYCLSDISPFKSSLP